MKKILIIIFLMTSLVAFGQDFGKWSSETNDTSGLKIDSISTTNKNGNILKVYKDNMGNFGITIKYKTEEDLLLDAGNFYYYIDNSDVYKRGKGVTYKNYLEFTNSIQNCIYLFKKGSNFYISTYYDPSEMHKEAFQLKGFKEAYEWLMNE